MQIPKISLFILALFNFFCCCNGVNAQSHNDSLRLNEHEIATLNQLRNEINGTYGLRTVFRASISVLVVRLQKRFTNSGMPNSMIKLK